MQTRFNFRIGKACLALCPEYGPASISRSALHEDQDNSADVASRSNGRSRINPLLLLRLWKHDTRFQCLFARRAAEGRGGMQIERTTAERQREGGRERERERGRKGERSMLRGRCCGNGLGARERRKDYEARHLAPRSHARASTCHVVCARGSRRSRPELSPTFALSAR